MMVDKTQTEVEKEHGVDDREPDMIVEHPHSIELIGEHNMLVISDEIMSYYDVYVVEEGDGGVYEARG